jgi:predicted lipoprotein with Yx(FWY)xxD motif
MRFGWLGFMLAALAIAGFAFFAAACGDDDDDGDGDGDAAPTATRAAAATEPADGPTEPAGGATEPAGPSGTETIRVADGGDLGQILVTLDGFTLYRFTNDTPGSGESACVDACANAWPPLVVPGEPTASADATGELGTITRPDGSTQVTYDGQPLYLFSSDAAAGDTNGQGVGGVWFVVEP